MAVQIQLRNDTAANWTTANPTLAVGEMGIETDTKKYKIGTGSTAWNSLAYSSLPAGSATLTGVETLTNKTLTSPNLTGAVQELTTVVGTGFAGYTYDAMTQADVLITANSTANGTVNIRGNSTTTLNTFMATGETITLSLRITNGATAYYPTAWQIDGVALVAGTNLRWQGGTAPTAGNASAQDVYAISITKTAASTYSVLISQTKFA